MTDNNYDPVDWVDGTTPVNKTNLDKMQTQYLLVAGVQQYDILPTVPATGENIAVCAGKVYFWNGSEWIRFLDSSQIKTAWSIVPTNDSIPGEKLVKDSLDGKVNMEIGKGLSTNDYDNTAKGKVDALGTASTKDTGTSEGNVPILGTDGKLPTSTIPSLAITDYKGNVATQADLVTLSTAEKGDWATVSADPTASLNGSWILDGDDFSVLANWKQLSGPGTVLSVNGQTGVVTITKADVGLGDTEDGAQINIIEVIKKNGSSLPITSKAVDISVPTALSELSEDTTHRVMTDTEKTKLEGIEADAQVNVIEIVKVNGIALTPDAEKAVNVPTTVPSGGIDQVFYVDSATTVSVTPPSSDVSVPVTLVGTTATEVDFLYTAPLASSFDTTTKMYFSIRFTGLTAGIQYGWRPVIRATVSGTTTVIAEIPISSSIYFTPTETEYYIVVAVPYALVAVFNAPAGTVFTVAVRMIKNDASTATVYITTDIVNGIFVYFQRSGGFINTDQVFHTDGGVTKSQTTINSEKVNIAQGIANASKNVVTDSAGNIVTEAKPTIPVVSTTTPIVNGTAVIGDEGKWADGKHVHPTDTSRQKSITVTTGTLTVAGWSANAQTISITGVTATTKSVRVSYAVASRDDYLASGIHCTAQGAGTLTFECDAVPTAEITVNVELAE